jgi:hypothetical protein
MNDSSARTLLDVGTGTIAMLLSGPACWQNLPTVEIRPDLIFNYQMMTMNMPDTAKSSFVEGQRALAHLLIDQLADALAEWATEHDRPDMLATVAERLEKAVMRDDVG